MLRLVVDGHLLDASMIGHDNTLEGVPYQFMLIQLSPMLDTYSIKFLQLTHCDQKRILGKGGSPDPETGKIIGEQFCYFRMLYF